MSQIAPFHHPFAHNIYSNRYQHPRDKNWRGTAERVVSHPMAALERLDRGDLRAEKLRLMDSVAHRQFMPGGRYLYASGRDFHQVNNCVLLRCPDSREGWSETSYQAEMALMTGAGIGVWYGDLRSAGTPVKRTGGTASGPLSKMRMINEIGREIVQGGARRSAIWAGLPWWHPEILDFITIKDWSDQIKALKEEDWNFPAPMDGTNISVTLDDEFFAYYKGDSTRMTNLNMFIEFEEKHGSSAPDGSDWKDWARKVYDTAVQHMLKHGEPGFTVDTGDKAGEVLRNACTEITSADDSDVCNLGSIVLPRAGSPREFGALVRDAVLFLTAGSVYSELPYEKVGEVREKNRRLGLGLIGVHEFLMLNGVRYGSDDAFEILDPYMREYDRALEYAHEWQDRFGLSLSKGATAIAPNGTIGAVAESTPSADPMFSAAESRQVKVANVHGADQFEEHIVVDPTAKRLRAQGVPAELIEDAYMLAEDPDRRLAQQAYLQQFVDHAISGTVNLPRVITDPSEAAEFGKTLMKYLPDLRGMTAYPDGARAGQPRTPVDLDWAIDNEGVIYEAVEDTCNGGVCGI